MISVVVPTKNEEKNLPNLLNALTSQTLEPDEIIVVDDFSTDRTVEIAKQYGCKVYKVRSTIGYARHYGTLKAKGDIILQTDADAIPVKTWVQTMSEAIQKYDADIVSGCIIKTNTLTERLIQTIASLRGYIAAANLGYLKKSYLQTEGFPDTSSMEDVRLVQSFKARGFRHVHLSTPKAFVYMNYNPTKWFINWIKNYII